MIFQTEQKQRKIPGMGAAIVLKQIKKAIIDDIAILNEPEIVYGCNMLLKHHGIFAGGFSGAVYYAAKTYLQKNDQGQKVTIILPDKGNSYINTIFNEDWLHKEELDYFLRACKKSGS
ncbi:MAG: hypothetical protein GY874_05760 [Desulfobacteraceae bacterium]|nr:hypothetical protein [Desulfobacteraceae bacterium]